MTPTSEKKKKVSCSYIHDDIAISILSKLAIKSLKRFTCVSKSWSLLFQNPNFINLFRNNLVSKSHDDDDDDDVCFLFVSYAFMSFFYLVSGERFQNVVNRDPLLPFEDQICRLFRPRIFCSAINGIVCVYNHCDHSEVALWNPVTQEVKVIPPGLVECLSNIHVYGTLCLHGFGYDHVKDDYKLIRHVGYRYIPDIYPRKEDFPMLPNSFWEIYSLRSNSWRKIIVDIPIPHFRCLGSKVYLNGVCHWLAVSDNGTTFVVSFNLTNDVFFTTPIDWHHRSSFRLAVLNGFIAMITRYHATESYTISILGEIGVKESWTRLFDIGPLSYVNDIIAVGKKGNIFLSIENGKIACFDLTTKVIEEIGFKREIHICQIVHYKKNLGPIGGINS
ncbi:putative F-box domain, galactose oxidase/kelch, beta-propeller, F-box associated interaction [Medicago truncatula]|uniref:F-box protein interaction domain protein n=1 Tax=Medicago truncatula TaxID=3880 RepID=A0A072U2L0_MEDTR|nr:putative F-box protein At3g16210 [Medicago truncatula]KEH20035.1 F-box protein interaction domain protein [Medicago truncatula]RHN41414.1 putative F-box domain, galactose oxidase/kelch, beta-propeller, F-box associated interaction [Medicago truncatula]